jgi:beta-lactamase regulating signal transducer with metallopeptidase domain/Flp pilus assembly protein TadD
MTEAVMQDTWADNAVGGMAWLSVRTAFLLALGLAAAMVLRRGSARQRHTMWSVTLIGVWLMTALGGMLPRWQFDQVFGSAVTYDWLPDASATGYGEDITEIQPVQMVDQRVLPSPMVKELVSSESLMTGRIGNLSESVEVSRPWSAWMLAIWASGFCFSLVWLGIGLQRVRRMTQRATVLADQDLMLLARNVAGEYGLSRRIRLLTSDELSTPITWGWLRPVIVVPESASAWSLERWRVVLLHEIAHIRRSDWLVQMMAHCVCAFHWFNPLAWWSHRRLTVERERACDEEVLSRGMQASRYATHLLEIARQMCSGRGGGITALGMARRVSHLEWRLRSILAHRGTRRRGLTWPMTLAVTGISILGLATLEPVGGMVAAGARSSAPSMAQAMPFIQAGEWTDAVEVLEEIIRRQPNHHRAWFFLGYALHYDGQVGRGIHATLRAAEAQGIRGLSFYNVSCAKALLGQTEESIKYLNRAFDAGFAGLDHLRVDPDLDSVRDLPEFQLLVAEREEMLRNRQKMMNSGQLMGLVAPVENPFATGTSEIDNKFVIEIAGHAKVSAGRIDVGSLVPGSTLTINSLTDGQDRRLVVTSDTLGRLEYDWSVNGTSLPFDESVEHWMALMLQANEVMTGADRIEGQISTLEKRAETLRARMTAIESTVVQSDGRDVAKTDVLNRLDGEWARLSEQFKEAQRMLREADARHEVLKQSATVMLQRLETIALAG